MLDGFDSGRSTTKGKWISILEINDHPTVIGGIPLPSDAPLFLLLIGLHIVVAAVCVVAGLVAMLSDKRSGRHPWYGTVYVWSLAGVFATMTVLSLLRWAENWHLFALGAASFSSALLGRAARRHQWLSWIPIHIISMGTSYVLLLTAFYVDNGKNLPAWNRLPQITFWILPMGIGAPLIIWQLLRNRPLRRSR